MTKGIRILFTRYTMVSAHLSIIPEFLEKIGLLGFENIFSVNKTEVCKLQAINQTYYLEVLRLQQVIKQLV